MAERRMFTKKIIDSDAFLDMPLTTQALYFHLNMRADDDGFVNNPKKICRMIGATDDDLKLLLAKRFVLGFESGVIVIKHWRMHNLIRGDRYHKTEYEEEFARLEIKENGSYTELATTWQPNGNQMATEVRLGKDRIVKDNDDLSINNQLSEYEKWSLMDACGSAKGYEQLIRYADAKLKRKQDKSEISNAFQYLMTIGMNDGFISED